MDYFGGGSCIPILIRLKAVETYIQCGKSAAVTVRILGYPSKKQLKRWYESYVDSDQILPRKKRKPKYNAAERRLEIEHYFRTGKCIARTERELGYPSQHWLRAWVKGDLPGATTNLSKLALKPARVDA